MEKLRPLDWPQNFPFEDKLNMRSKDIFFRLSWSMNKLRTISEVGSKTEAESMEASKTKVKINGGRQTSAPLRNLTQSCALRFKKVKK